MPVLSDPRDTAHDNDSESGTIRELQQAQVSTAYVQRMSTKSQASTVSQYPESDAVTRPVALPKPPPPIASSFITWGSPGGSPERRPTAVSNGRYPNSSRLPISNPMVMQQVNASRPLHPNRFVGSSPLSGATQYSQYERPRPAPIVLGEQGNKAG